MGSTISPAQKAKLAAILYKKLPQNTGMQRLFDSMTVDELKGSPDTVLLACMRNKLALAKVRGTVN